MKKLLIVLLLFCLGCSEKGNDQELRTLLYEQLKQSHSQENWFVPMEVALKGAIPGTSELEGQHPKSFHW